MQCPAFLVGSDQTRVLGSNLNGPICSIKLLPLIQPSQGPDVARRVLSHVAKNCDKYGTDVRHDTLSDQAAPEFRVGMMGDSEHLQRIDNQDDARCHSCEHHVDSSKVNAETGWTGSICRATGNLMPDSRLHLYAKKCGAYRRQVGIRKPGRLDEFTFYPQFSANFGKVDFAKVYSSKLDDFIDPMDYPNERDLSPRLEEKMHERGIRAWRRVKDPAGYGEDVWFPIYDLKSFPAEEKEIIPRTGDREHPELYADHGQLLYTMAVLWMKLDETPAWWGQGGSGKTEFARHLAWLMAAPFHRLNITGSTEIDDIAGKMLFEDGQTKFHYGRLPRAWMRPGVILLDEPNTGPAEVWQLIRPLTDNSQMLVLDQNKGERIKRNPDCYFTLAMNPAWDPRNVGAQSIGDADASRLVHMFFSPPPEDLEIEIIQRRVKLDGWEVPSHHIKAMMKASKELREASDTGVLHSTWGMRHQLQVARALRWFQPATAYRRALADFLEPEQLEVVNTIVSSHFKE